MSARSCSSRTMTRSSTAKPADTSPRVSKLRRKVREESSRESPKTAKRSKGGLLSLKGGSPKVSGNCGKRPVAVSVDVELANTTTCDCDTTPELESSEVSSSSFKQENVSLDSGKIYRSIDSMYRHLIMASSTSVEHLIVIIIHF